MDPVESAPFHRPLLGQSGNRSWPSGVSNPCVSLRGSRNGLEIAVSVTGVRFDLMLSGVEAAFQESWRLAWGYLVFCTSGFTKLFSKESRLC